MNSEAILCAEFAREAVAGQKVIALSQNRYGLVFQDRSASAWTFWSSIERAESIRSARAEYEPFEIREISLKGFISMIASFAADHTRVGANWTSETFTKRFDASQDADDVIKESVSAHCLRESLERELARREPTSS